MSGNDCKEGGACRCTCLNCQVARKREDHCGQHGSGCHLECNRWK